MTTTLTIRKAEPSDLDVVEDVRAEAIAWLASKGLDQWQPNQPRVPTRASTVDAIDRGVCFLAYDDADQLVGTITIDDRADPEFWTAAERTEPALYVHRMVVRRDLAGNDLGGALLEWASELALRRGKGCLRLDAWRTNSALHDYYKRHGFTHVRSVELSHRGSGALFQRAVAAAAPIGGRGLTT